MSKINKILSDIEHLTETKLESLNFSLDKQDAFGLKRDLTSINDKISVILKTLSSAIDSADSNEEIVLEKTAHNRLYNELLAIEKSLSNVTTSLSDRDKILKK